MQHIVHIFIGNELISFRDKFASLYRSLHSNHEESLFTAISMIEDNNGAYILSPDESGDPLDGVTVDKNERQTVLYNFFEDLYRRKVTVAHPGNHSMVVILWAKLYLDDNVSIIEEITKALNKSDSNFNIELAGFTHDAVSCFIPNPLERLSPEIYKKAFDSNIENLRHIRPNFSALRLVANRNMDNVALDLNEESMARICAEHSAILCEHYLSIHPTVIDIREFPFETFGISSILFDLEYYQAYIKNKILIEKMQNQGIENRVYNLNALSKRTNPVLQKIIDEIHEFKDKQASDAKAALALKGGANTSNIIGTIDSDVKNIVKDLENRIQALLSTGQISIFECEALLSLILGEDCTMFDSSAVDAEEITIDDIINEAAEYFIELDTDNNVLTNVSQEAIKSIRKSMRNIAVANRQRQDKIKALNLQINENKNDEKHLNNEGYNFGGITYKVNLNIDNEPLELTYEAHDVNIDNVDLSSQFAPIRNQGKQGSCASFAVSSVIEVLRGDKKRYSPAFLYWSAREETSTTSTDSGASLYDVIKGATKKGICLEDSMPYSSENFTLAPTEAATKEALDCLIIEAKTVNPKLRDIKSALSDGYPVIVAAKIFDSFSDTRSGFVRHPSSQELASGARTDGHGNHAMVVCGYSDKERVLIVRNSWGRDFGVNGYCYIPYSYAQQYFLQACIITKISSTNTENLIEHKTINFNLSDSNIEAAVLQNLIEEDEYELQSLAEDSAKLRTEWAQNIATLGNVNNQAQIINNSRIEIDKEIERENSIISQLQESEPGKVKDFKRGYIKGIIISLLITLGLLVGLYFNLDSILMWVITVISSLVSMGILCAYRYKWRKFRQDLRDDIQNHANRVNRLELRKTNQEIKAHIYGTVLRETEQYRLNLFSQFQTLKRFNREWLKLFEKVKEEQREMTPIVPYPFLAVLENNLLDVYYTTWHHKMVDSINLTSIFSSFVNGLELSQILQSDQDFNNAVVRGLKNFSMKEYITRQNPGKWQFLPNTASMADVIPDLDSRATPFCPYNNHTDNSIEKYIFVKDITQDEMNNISRYFSQAPMPISDSDPYSISVLNVVRYNI